MSPNVYRLPGLGPFIALGAFLLAALLLVCHAMTTKGRRRRKISAWAKAQGFSFANSLSNSREIPDSLLAPFKAATLLDEISKPKAENIVRSGDDLLTWLIFDLHGWREHRFEESAPVRWTITALTIGLQLPSLHIKPRLPILSRIEAYRHPILRTGHHEFDRKFLLTGNGSGILTGEMQACLLELTHAKNRWYRELFFQDDMIIVLEAGLASPRHIEDMMAIASKIKDCILPE